MGRNTALGLIVPAVLAAAGCATLFTGTRQDITIETEPPGARVRIGGIDYGTTPVTFPLKKPGINSRTITLQREGYESRIIELPSSFNTVSILNIFVFPRWVVDFLTGAIMNYDPTNFSVRLDPERSAELTAALSVGEVVSVTDIPNRDNQLVVIPDDWGGSQIAIFDPVTGDLLILR